MPVTPMRLLRIPEPFDHPGFIFEPKLDGFRALAHVHGHRCELVSRNGHSFKQWAAVDTAVKVGDRTGIGRPRPERLATGRVSANPRARTRRAAASKSAYLAERRRVRRTVRTRRPPDNSAMAAVAVAGLNSGAANVPLFPVFVPLFPRLVSVFPLELPPRRPWASTALASPNTRADAATILNNRRRMFTQPSRKTG